MQSRREFLLKMSIATSGIMLPWRGFTGSTDKLGKLLPLRKLGNTGEMVTMLGVGGYHIGEPSEYEAQQIIETAIERGIRFFDNAHDYHQGESEKRYGKFLIPKYREQIFLMTKTNTRDYKSAKEDLERSLSRMNTDHVDLWQIHSLTNAEDVDNRVKNGVLRAVEEALKEKKARYVGFTGHNSPKAHLRMLEHAKGSGLFTTVQMPVNVVDANSNPSFIKHVMPKLLEENIGILGMKSLADGRFFSNKIRANREIWKTGNPVVPNYITVEEASRFAWSMPISSLMTGAQSVELLNEKIDFAEKLAVFTEKQRSELIDKINSYPSPNEIEYYKQDRDYTL